MNRLAIFISTILLLSSCIGGDSSSSVSHSDAKHLKPIYAEGFDIYIHDGFTEVQLFSPWNHNDLVLTYYLVESDTVTTPQDGIRVQIPLRHVAATSVTQYGFLSALGEYSSIRGICSPELTFDHIIDSLYNIGGITNLGDAFNLNSERLIMLAPDAVFTTFYNESSISEAGEPQTGIIRVYDNEWTESTLLARAEWIKFVAAFYGKLPLADSIFRSVESSYKASLEKLKTIDRPKTVMLGNNFRGTWYMPGGKSYMGNLLRDAHTSYLYENDTTTGSLPLSFEQVLTGFSNADVWLNAPVSTIDALIRMDERHSLFRPVSTGNVFAFLRRTTPSGANDFWESGILHPDLILNDLIWALYPSLLTDYQPTYIIKCE